MIRSTLSLLLCILSITCIAQQRPLLVYDIQSGSIDSIFNPGYDSVILSDRTDHFIGFYDNYTAPLSDQVPTTNLFPNSEFTRKRQASLDYNLTDFPLRTVVSLRVETDSGTFHLCSGSMVSRRHVLTATHCLLSFGIDSLIQRNITACPILDNGMPSSQFQCISANKVYAMKNWSSGWQDIALIELDEPIGDKTGWIGFGFNHADSAFDEELFYKFSYPGAYLPQFDSNHYNGDTLYYGFGKAEVGQQIVPMIVSPGVTGIRGESGSSIIAVKNDDYYTSYGVLSWALDIQHRSFDNEIFYALKNVIGGDLLSTSELTNSTSTITPFPNPSAGFIGFQNPSELTFDHLQLTNQLGQVVLQLGAFETQSGLDISHLPDGMYYLALDGEGGVKTYKIVKSQ